MVEDQITNYIGKTVVVTLKNMGDLGQIQIAGRLSFYNYKDRAIHLNTYKKYDMDAPQSDGCIHGKFIVVNSSDWVTCEVRNE